jgi:hypothetical protein
MQDIPVPDWFSAGADRTTDSPASVRWSYRVRMLTSAQPSSFTRTMLLVSVVAVRRVVSRKEERIFNNHKTTIYKIEKRERRNIRLRQYMTVQVLAQDLNSTDLHSVVTRQPGARSKLIDRSNGIYSKVSVLCHCH